ncbi:FAD-dependent oxidoreductase [uncultured Desulfosarcina sp.]|uniref:flavin monoamine oxidase family protein n=1 Tax=uncultured Desulfosarcina sp. TaxID=218289 RepID=UPI0029C80FF8|nr:FAD-dependent oxidoreductase [uncultured Desulfosarcina sp.]
MTTEAFDTIIIGGGLSGLYCAHLLAAANRSFVVLEARDRLGGRILSPAHQGFHSDLGPSWYWPAIQPRMMRLIQSLNLSGYPQFETGLGRFQSFAGTVRTVQGYATQPASWRLCGGMQGLVESLEKTIPEDAIRLNHPVCHIEKCNTGVQVSVGDLEAEPRARFDARHVILALPPRLAAATILFTPELSHQLTQAMLKIGTWMAGQAKFCAFYESPFWRRAGLSGQAFSEYGPLGEIHDGSSPESKPCGLTGFVGIPAAQRSQKEKLTEAILGQLALLFGEPASRPLAFFYQDWARERFTATPYDQPPMHQHPLYHPPAGKAAIWEETVLFAGTETASEQGGYLEGALVTAELVIKRLQA